MIVAGTMPKAPGETVDFSVSWTLPTDDALTSADCVTVSGTVTVDAVQRVSNSVTVWVSGGAVDENARLEMTCHTTLGRVLQRAVYVEVK